ncbi:MAG: ectonucleotide pyrophosphatase/phosphodiesterase [candidate division KSB1 bacterium]|nr:ectonucleotide pyrophosphatase/phosphodiesterase [candidate division KSB1 bacterium]
MQLKRLAVLAGLILAGGIRPAAAQEAVGPGNRITDLAPTVILISIDGFRHDYLDRAAAPNLQRLARNGVRAHGMIPAFPSKTFPNHYTLVTGLYPEHHGIVSNTMLDPEGKARFRISDRAAVEDSRWWGGEPLWVTAQKQGQLTATYFWVGSEAEILGTRPAYWKRYAHNTPNRARVAQVLAWLDLPKPQRPTLITLYFSTVDEAGHEFGPDSPEVMQAVAAIDTVIGTLLEGLAARDIFQQVNLIIVSDHGMAATSAGRVIHLDDYLDLQQVDVIDWTPVLALLPRPGEEEAVYQKLCRSSAWRTKAGPSALVAATGGRAAATTAMTICCPPCAPPLSHTARPSKANCRWRRSKTFMSTIWHVRSCTSCRHPMTAAWIPCARC